MIACEVWLRRDYLIRNGHDPDEPACGHDDCPDPAAAATEAHRYPDHEETP